jgi:aspartyl-tRNA synthetase
VIRTHEAGSLREEHAGSTVTLAGWVARRRDHGGVAFLDLRDAGGVVQVVVRENDIAHDLRAEYCVRVVGQVRVRPEGNRNDALPTGDVEVAADDVQVLSPSAPLPFPLDDDAPIGEETRLKYRYLDLRRAGPAQALRTRSLVTRAIRRVMDERDFLDIETPTLTRSTPEGARDFLVPVRLQPGTWYALPQSPQLFKQLLMVAGMERYYQIARCYRDEDFRADRQPEFTQLDIEMSFPDEEDVYELAEALMSRIWRDVLGVELGTPFPRMSYAEAMRRFGVDRPDVRFGVELVDLTAYFADTPFRVFQAASAPGGHVGAVVMPGGADQPRKTFDAWQEWARQRGAKGLAYVTFLPDGTLGGPVAKNLSEAERDGLREAVGAEVGDCAFFAAGPRAEALGLLGATRLEIGRRLGLLDDSRWEFLWVTDFPMFEPVPAADGSTAGWTAVHHPFTAPAASHEQTFHTSPADVPARAYDLVLNGAELGGGSIRIHSSDVQRRVFDVIGLSQEQAEEQFGFLLEAFAYGPPPHGGIAFGIDRIAAMLTGSESIREVIAFPKTGNGGDPLTGAPTPITAEQRREAGIDATPAEDG